MVYGPTLGGHLVFDQTSEKPPDSSSTFGKAFSTAMPLRDSSELVSPQSPQSSVPGCVYMYVCYINIQIHYISSIPPSSCQIADL